MSDMEWPPEQVEAVRRRLSAMGATDEEMDIEPYDLPGVALDVTLRGKASLSARALAERTEMTLDELVQLYRELGIAVEDPDEVRFTETEVELAAMLRWAVEDQFTPEEGHELIVVVARSLQAMADASVSGFVQTIETRLLAEGGSLEDWTESTIAASSMGLQLGDSLGALFSHYLRQAVDHQRAGQRDVTSRAVMRVAVGFVDLVGFTPLSSSLSPEELSRLVGEFESRAFDMANAAGVRIVKHIGDEIMFTSIDPSAACRLAIEFRNTVDTTTGRPRGGVAYGEVITRHGDYYGPIVNLASRLTDEAIPGEILVPEALRDVASDLAFEPAGRRELKGFDEPIAVFSLSNPGDGP